MAKLVGIDLDFGTSAGVTNLRAPVEDNDAVRLVDLRSAVEGLAWKDAARVSTQGNLNLASPGATIDGVTMVSGDRVLVRQQSSAAENGIYIWNGASTAATRSLDASTAVELEEATLSVEEGTDAGTTWRQTAVNFTLGSGTVTWAAFGAAVGNASESSAGKVELATQGEVDAGSDTGRVVTPATLAGWSGRIRKYSANVGDGSNTQYDVTHNFGTRAVHVSVYRNSGSYDDVIVDVGRPDTNTVRLNFATAPSSNAYAVVIVG